jgi:hypothetical protein
MTAVLQSASPLGSSAAPALLPVRIETAGDRWRRIGALSLLVRPIGNQAVDLTDATVSIVAAIRAAGDFYVDQTMQRMAPYHVLNAGLLRLRLISNEKDIVARTQKMEGLLDTLDGLAADIRAVPIADFATELVRNLIYYELRYRHPIPLNHHQSVRAARTVALRSFFSGSRPVRDRDAFTEFHLGLGPDERYLLALIMRDGSVAHWRIEHSFGHRQADPAKALALSRTAAAVGSLLAGGWIAPSDPPATNSSGHPFRNPSYLRGPRVHQINQADGEALEP